MKRIILFLALTACAWSQPTMPFAVWKSAAVSGYTFKPSDITSGTLKLWLYADTLKTLESKSAGDTLYRWQDISGNGYHMVNTTASQKPVLRDSASVWGATGGSVQFDGTDDYLSVLGPAIDTTVGITVFTVVKLKSFTGQYHGMWGARTNNTLLSAFASTNASYRDLHVGYNPTGTAPLAAKFAGFVPTTRRVVAITAKSPLTTQFTARQDSIELTRSEGYGLGTFTNQHEIGRPGGWAAYWNGCIEEHIVYEGMLPIADIRKVEEYLRRKYSL